MKSINFMYYGTLIDLDYELDDGELIPLYINELSAEHFDDDFVGEVALLADRVIKEMAEDEEDDIRRRAYSLVGDIL